jgi:hypothetical protein
VKLHLDVLASTVSAQLLEQGAAVATEYELREVLVVLSDPALLDMELR